MNSKQILFRLGAIGLGVMPFVLLECALRLLGFGRPGSASDSLSGFNRNLPLFERQGTVYRTVAARDPFFSAQEFPVPKPPNGFRIFCFGGSTVHGHPYQSETAFPEWLEMELAGSDPSRLFQAVNCGGVSYASYRLAPLVKEVLAYQPDLIIVMTGENEFLEDRTYQAIKERSAMRTWIENASQSLRIVNVARNLIHGPRASAPGHRAGPEEAAQPSAEVKTRLDDRSGYASYHRDDAWRDRVAAQFEESLRTIVGQCRVAGVPVLLVKPGSNLRDCPPFKSEHRPNLSPEEERGWQAALEAATAEEGAAESVGPQRLSNALKHYRNAGKVDAEYALLDWRMALALDRLGKKAEALECYLKARDNDVCPLRTPARHEAILDQIATETGTPLVDAAALFASKSPDGIPGNNWYLDHVHPTIGGHQKIAQAIAARVRQIGLVSANSTWPEEQRRAAYARHLKKLGPNYLADGRRRVEWLENWARRERLLAEASPKDARGYLHLGFRRLDFGDELGAWEAFSEALKLDGRVAGVLQEHARELAAEGREDASAGLRWRLGRSEH